MKTTEQIDPQQVFKGLGPILFLDTLKIYGPRIWMLYKDACKENLIHVLGMLRAVQLGLVDDSVLDFAIDNMGEGLDIDAAMKQVRERLDQFCATDELPSDEIRKEFAAASARAEEASSKPPFDK